MADPKLSISLDDMSTLQVIAHLVSRKDTNWADDLAKDLKGDALQVAQMLTSCDESPNENVKKIAAKLRDRVPNVQQQSEALVT